MKKILFYQNSWDNDDDRVQPENEMGLQLVSLKHITRPTS